MSELSPQRIPAFIHLTLPVEKRVVSVTVVPVNENDMTVIDVQLMTVSSHDIHYRDRGIDSHLSADDLSSLIDSDEMMTDTVTFSHAVVGKVTFCCEGILICARVIPVMGW